MDSVNVLFYAFSMFFRFQMACIMQENKVDAKGSLCIQRN